MRIEELNIDNTMKFIDYCKKHRNEVDESFLYEEDLRDFKLLSENPTYIALDENEQVVATVSLIIDDYNRKARKARFRIFHSELHDFKIYELLFKKIIKHVTEIDDIFIFVPIESEYLMNMFSKLGFEIERYSFFMAREDAATELLEDEEIELDRQQNEVLIPEGYAIKPYVKHRDEKAWCDIRNAAFVNLKGNETPQTPEMVIKMASADDYLDGGMLLLYHGDKPVGVVRGSADELDGMPVMNIGPVAVIPGYQGKGLGRVLLRSAIRFAQEHAYDRTVLCVNADNEIAKRLYTDEGFRQVEAVACFNYTVKRA
jgi:mycothiol synthase